MFHIEGIEMFVIAIFAEKKMIVDLCPSPPPSIHFTKEEMTPL